MYSTVQCIVHYILFYILYTLLYCTTNTMYTSADYSTVQCTIHYIVLCSTVRVHHIVYCTLCSVKWGLLAGYELLRFLLLLNSLKMANLWRNMYEFSLKVECALWLRFCCTWRCAFCWLIEREKIDSVSDIRLPTMETVGHMRTKHNILCWSSWGLICSWNYSDFPCHTSQLIYTFELSMQLTAYTRQRCLASGENAEYF